MPRRALDGRAAGTVLRLVLLGALAVPFTACTAKTPAEKLVAAAEPVGSWLATLRMTAEKWGANSVPAHFARDTAKAADKQLEKAAATADESPAPAALREPLRRLLAESRAATRDFRRAVRVGDRGAAVAAASRFHALGDAFDEWKQSADTSSR